MLSRGDVSKGKSALTREPLEALLATCDDSLTGKRDRALLLFAWGTGGRRRSEVTAATLENVARNRGGTYPYFLERSKTNAPARAGRRMSNPWRRGRRGRRRCFQLGWWLAR